MAELQIRPYHPADLPDLKAIFLDAVHRGCSKDYTSEQRNAWAPKTLDTELWRERLKKNRCWLAEEGGIPVGFTELIDSGHVQMLFVLSEYHRQGIASALLAELENTATQQGIRTLTTEASRTARPFFEKSGFEIICAQSVAMQEVTLQNFKMVKTL